MSSIYRLFVASAVCCCAVLVLILNKEKGVRNVCTIIALLAGVVVFAALGEELSKATHNRLFSCLFAMPYEQLITRYDHLAQKGDFQQLSYEIALANSNGPPHHLDDASLFEFVRDLTQNDPAMEKPHTEQAPSEVSAEAAAP